jgi:hypothetical protein
MVSGKKDTSTSLCKSLVHKRNQKGIYVTVPMDPEKGSKDMDDCDGRR